ncbi:transposase, partial [Paraburkholderia azotifigens]|uniref:transposase n=1 Tax=Paraburkholderia azotifigens TaxID=2057004 RepID=UPI003180AB34
MVERGDPPPARGQPATQHSTEVRSHQIAGRKSVRRTGSTSTMTLTADEFIRRFLLHVLPDGFKRIRSYGWLANCHRAQRLAI